jgi:hypothetical protein
MLKEKEQVVAMIAPAIEGQFPGNLAQIMAGIRELGFTDVVEVAEGALVTAAHEADEVKQRISAKAGFMTTSCCLSYMNLSTSMFPPESTMLLAHSPMAYTPSSVASVSGSQAEFVGRVWRRDRGLGHRRNHTVITFSELAALWWPGGGHQGGSATRDGRYRPSPMQEFACSQALPDRYSAALRAGTG